MNRFLKAMRLFGALVTGIMIIALAQGNGFSNTTCFILGALSTVFIMISNLIYYRLGELDEEL